jgi:RND family efflux transporter MFP subunit
MMFSRSFEPARPAALVLSAVLLAACGNHEKAAVRSTVDADVVVVQRASLLSFHSVAGTVRSETTSTLAANVVGTVTRVLVAEGDRVRAGDLLVQIDAREGQANVDRTRAGSEELERTREAAAANAQLAETTFRRFEALRGRGSASQQEYDEAKARNSAAQAELARLGARRREVNAASAQASAVLDYSSVRAPIDGVVTARFVDAGAQAAPGVALVTIEQEAATRIDSNVPEHVVVRVGDRAVIEAGEQRLDARVVRVQPTIDAGARSSLVKLQLDKPLRAGTYVKVSFAIGTRDVVTVPVAALVHRGQLDSVFVVGSDRVARMRLVTIGANDGANAEVLSGLDAGESIVPTPAQVREGAIVRSGA